MTERVAIVGSRGFRDLALVRAYVRSLPQDVVIVSGGADGPDRAAISTALLTGRGWQVFPADWDKHGRAAGPIRNGAIVANADRLVAFWDGQSRGTADVVARARKRGIPVVEVLE